MTPDELCVNGMSFSRRQSQWANAALVVGTAAGDWRHHAAQHGVLAGVQLQVDAERWHLPPRMALCDVSMLFERHMWTAPAPPQHLDIPSL